MIEAMTGRTHFSMRTLVTALPFIKEWLQAMGIVPAPTTPEEHDKTLRAQIETLSKVVRDAGLRPK